MNAGAADGKDAEKVFLDMPAMQSNQRSIGYVRTFMNIVAGVATGIMGCTSFYGAAAFLALHLGTSLGIALLMGGDTKQYTNLSFPRFLVDAMFTNAGSFLLFWTLFYALVYIY
mmetsp:Transcript_1747/g.4967  ORF Transcript_1747/g.4967 Transcript_1747/m.4967 type:complete len:114 (-) Transcript_1747:139-480(-)|eukprot:CAMPEP_0118873894 /NCGR_PEP_ID=MMETSP1163-20130328/15528_1 /TAXON_ID=124430 /ORGANISM="Phaeomonas parva, Strain CCMP2877" /LENGTH=113 /DNA_ID=CAMNT_0006809215 /DNA_START=118 /DNA_END=459 /DNA_ORIENTATION=+